MNHSNLNLTAVYVSVPEGGYAAYIEEIPGVNTQGETLSETKKNLRIALFLVLETNKILSQRQFGEKLERIREPLSFA
jgi:predicted RNase H-like HicB family nuclease